MDIHVYLHSEPDRRVTDALAQILTQLNSNLVKETNMNADLQAAIDRNTAAANAEVTIEASVETLLSGLAATIAGLKSGVTDPAVLAAIDNASSIVEAANAKAAAAVVANTPAA